MVVHPDAALRRKESTTTWVHIDLKQVIPVDMVEWHRQIGEIFAHRNPVNYECKIATSYGWKFE